MKKKMLAGMAVTLLAIMVGCGQKAIEQPVTETKSSDSKVEVVTSSSSKKETKNTNENKETKVEKVNAMSIEEVIKVYQDKYPKTDITSIELESERSGLVYEVKGVDDNDEYKLTIDAKSKKITKDKTESLDKDERDGIKRKQEKLDLKEVISLDEATKIAEKESKFGKAKEWSLDSDLGITYWELKGLEGRKETQIKIDAKTGKVLEFKLDD